MPPRRYPWVSIEMEAAARVRAARDGVLFDEEYLERYRDELEFGRGYDGSTDEDPEDDDPPTESELWGAPRVRRGQREEPFVPPHDPRDDLLYGYTADGLFDLDTHMRRRRLIQEAQAQAAEQGVPCSWEYLRAYFRERAAPPPSQAEIVAYQEEPPDDQGEETPPEPWGTTYNGQFGDPVRPPWMVNPEDVERHARERERRRPEPTFPMQYAPKTAYEMIAGPPSPPKPKTAYDLIDEDD